MKEKKSKWGLISQMAEACQCQNSHFSRVMAGKVDLTLEQACGLIDFFQFNETEADFFLNLVQWSRAGTKQLKNRIEKKISTIRREQEDLSKRLNKQPIGVEEKEITYYSSWSWSAIHILISIPEFQSVSMIAKKLALPESLILFCLETMKKFGLVSEANGRWTVSSPPIHLPKTSPLIGLHHNNWRARAILSSQNPQDDGVHYTVVQTISRADFDRIKSLFLDTIEEYMKIAGPSKEEELVNFCLDWYKV